MSVSSNNVKSQVSSSPQSGDPQKKFPDSSVGATVQSAPSIASSPTKSQFHEKSGELYHASSDSQDSKLNDQTSASPTKTSPSSSPHIKAQQFDETMRSEITKVLTPQVTVASTQFTAWNDSDTDENSSGYSSEDQIESIAQSKGRMDLIPDSPVDYMESDFDSLNSVLNPASGDESMAPHDHTSMLDQHMGGVASTESGFLHNDVPSVDHTEQESLDLNIPQGQSSHFDHSSYTMPVIDDSSPGTSPSGSILKGDVRPSVSVATHAEQEDDLGLDVPEGNLTDIDFGSASPSSQRQIPSSPSIQNDIASPVSLASHAEQEDDRSLDVPEGNLINSNSMSSSLPQTSSTLQGGMVRHPLPTPVPETSSTLQGGGVASPISAIDDQYQATLDASLPPPRHSSFAIATFAVAAHSGMQDACIEGEKSVEDLHQFIIEYLNKKNQDVAYDADGSLRQTIFNTPCQRLSAIAQRIIDDLNGASPNNTVNTSTLFHLIRTFSDYLINPDDKIVFLVAKIFIQDIKKEFKLIHQHYAELNMTVRNPEHRSSQIAPRVATTVPTFDPFTSRLAAVHLPTMKLIKRDDGTEVYSLEDLAHLAIEAHNLMNDPVCSNYLPKESRAYKALCLMLSPGLKEIIKNNSQIARFLQKITARIPDPESVKAIQEIDKSNVDRHNATYPQSPYPPLLTAIAHNYLAQGISDPTQLPTRLWKIENNEIVPVFTNTECEQILQCLKYTTHAIMDSIETRVANGEHANPTNVQAVVDPMLQSIADARTLLGKKKYRTHQIEFWKTAVSREIETLIYTMITTNPQSISRAARKDIGDRVAILNKQIRVPELAELFAWFSEEPAYRSEVVTILTPKSRGLLGQLRSKETHVFDVTQPYAQTQISAHHLALNLVALSSSRIRSVFVDQHEKLKTRYIRYQEDKKMLLHRSALQLNTLQEQIHASRRTIDETKQQLAEKESVLAIAQKNHPDLKNTIKQIKSEIKKVKTTLEKEVKNEKRLLAQYKKTKEDDLRKFDALWKKNAETVTVSRMLKQTYISGARPVSPKHFLLKPEHLLGQGMPYRDTVVALQREAAEISKKLELLTDQEFATKEMLRVQGQQVLPENDIPQSNGGSIQSVFQIAQWHSKNIATLGRDFAHVFSDDESFPSFYTQYQECRQRVQDLSYRVTELYHKRGIPIHGALASCLNHIQIQCYFINKQINMHTRSASSIAPQTVSWIMQTYTNLTNDQKQPFEDERDLDAVLKVTQWQEWLQDAADSTKSREQQQVALQDFQSDLAKLMDQTKSMYHYLFVLGIHNKPLEREQEIIDLCTSKHAEALLLAKKLVKASSISAEQQQLLLQDINDTGINLMHIAQMHFRELKRKDTSTSDYSSALPSHVSYPDELSNQTIKANIKHYESFLRNFPENFAANQEEKRDLTKHMVAHPLNLDVFLNVHEERLRSIQKEIDKSSPADQQHNMRRFLVFLEESVALAQHICIAHHTGTLYEHWQTRGSNDSLPPPILQKFVNSISQIAESFSTKMTEYEDAPWLQSFKANWDALISKIQQAKECFFNTHTVEDINNGFKVLHLATRIHRQDNNPILEDPYNDYYFDFDLKIDEYKSKTDILPDIHDAVTQFKFVRNTIKNYLSTPESARALGHGFLMRPERSVAQKAEEMLNALQDYSRSNRAWQISEGTESADLERLTTQLDYVAYIHDHIKLSLRDLQIKGLEVRSLVDFEPKVIRPQQELLLKLEIILQSPSLNLSPSERRELEKYRFDVYETLRMSKLHLQHLAHLDVTLTEILKTNQQKIYDLRKHNEGALESTTETIKEDIRSTFASTDRFASMLDQEVTETVFEEKCSMIIKPLAPVIQQELKTYTPLFDRVLNEIIPLRMGKDFAPPPQRTLLSQKDRAQIKELFVDVPPQSVDRHLRPIVQTIVHQTECILSEHFFNQTGKVMLNFDDLLQQPSEVMYRCPQLNAAVGQLKLSLERRQSNRATPPIRTELNRMISDLQKTTELKYQSVMPLKLTTATEPSLPQSLRSAQVLPTSAQAITDAIEFTQVYYELLLSLEEDTDVFHPQTDERARLIKQLGNCLSMLEHVQKEAYDQQLLLNRGHHQKLPVELIADTQSVINTGYYLKERYSQATHALHTFYTKNVGEGLLEPFDASADTPQLDPLTDAFTGVEEYHELEKRYLLAKLNGTPQEEQLKNELDNLAIAVKPSETRQKVLRSIENMQRVIVAWRNDLLPQIEELCKQLSVLKAASAKLDTLLKFRYYDAETTKKLSTLKETLDKEIQEILSMISHNNSQLDELQNQMLKNAEQLGKLVESDHKHESAKASIIYILLQRPKPDGMSQKAFEEDQQKMLSFLLSKNALVKTWVSLSENLKLLFGESFTSTTFPNPLELMRHKILTSYLPAKASLHEALVTLSKDRNSVLYKGRKAIQKGRVEFLKKLHIAERNKRLDFFQKFIDLLAPTPIKQEKIYQQLLKLLTNSATLNKIQEMTSITEIRKYLFDQLKSKLKKLDHTPFDVQTFEIVEGNSSREWCVLNPLLSAASAQQALCTDIKLKQKFKKEIAEINALNAVAQAIMEKIDLVTENALCHEKLYLEHDHHVTPYWDT